MISESYQGAVGRISTGRLCYPGACRSLRSSLVASPRPAALETRLKVGTSSDSGRRAPEDAPQTGQPHDRRRGPLLAPTVHSRRSPGD